MKFVYSWITIFILILAASTAQAQPAIVKSQPVIKARGCIDMLQQQGEKAGLYTDRDGGQILILNPTRKELLPLLLNMTRCLDGAYPKSEIVKHPDTGTRSRIWFYAADGYYAYCATGSLDTKIEAIDVLGGYGPRRDWYGLLYECQIREAILGFYRP